MRRMRMNTCMGTINGTSVDRLPYTMQRYWYLHGLKTWSEYMNMHAVNTCKQWWKYSCKCVLQFLTKTTTIQCAIICAHDDEYAHEYLHVNNSWKHFMEQQSFGCRRRCTYVGDGMHWKHGVNTWTRMNLKQVVNIWTWMQWIHESKGESIYAHVYYKFVIKEKD